MDAPGCNLEEQQRVTDNRERHRERETERERDTHREHDLMIMIYEDH